MKVERRVALFLLPVGAKRTLTEVGWEFESGRGLSETLVMELLQELDLLQTEAFLGIQVFRGGGVQANIQRSNLGMIESVYFQVPVAFLGPLKSALSGIPNADLFVPSEE